MNRLARWVVNRLLADAIDERTTQTLIRWRAAGNMLNHDQKAQLRERNDR